MFAAPSRGDPLRLARGGRDTHTQTFKKREDEREGERVCVDCMCCGVWIAQERPGTVNDRMIALYTKLKHICVMNCTTCAYISTAYNGTN